MQTKHLFLTAILLVFSMLVVAAPVDPMRALEVAEQFAPQSAKAKRIKSKTAPEQSYEIVYTHRMPNSDHAAFYVVKLGEKGFVIISADDVANPILGYSYTNSWPTSVSAQGDTLLPPQVLSFLNDMALQIETAIEKYPNLDSSEEWNNVGQKAVRKTSARKSADALPDSVGPLLTTTWGQGQYYNALCPEDAEGEDGHVPTGCVATAMAQIINYWGQKEEIKTRGIHSYDCQYGNLTVNYDSTSYDFANMPDALTAESTPEQINAVAKLMYECGVAVNMDYNAGTSGAYNEDARAALINFYRFNPDFSIAERAYFSSKKWDKLLQSNIANNQPIYYAGQNLFNGGHAFICDGYNAVGYYHFNFGWNGLADGWYLTSAVSPNGVDFSSNQLVLVGIVPDNTSNVILGQTTGNSVFKVKEPLEFYHLMGHNAYDGTSYKNQCNNHVLFKSADESTPLILDILEYEDQNVTIYDGEWREELRYLYAGQENNLSPVVSTGNALRVEYSGNMYYSGFYFAISRDEGCRRVSNIVTSVDTTTIHLTWQENGIATQWQIEYGESGFILGNGKIINTSKKNIDIAVPNKFKEYDFYIRPICDMNTFGPWSRVVSVTSLALYWTDVINEQPEGYIEDECGNVFISSAEGLAWLCKVSNGLTEWGYDQFREKTITLLSDIDMGAYRWLPLGCSHIGFMGVFDGNGHTISNIYVNEPSEDHVGFIASTHTACIKNVVLKSIYISGGCLCAGGLLGTCESTSILNCLVQGKILGRESSGGLLGEGRGMIDIINCASICDVYGGNCVGGIAAVMSTSKVRNCYSACNVFTSIKDCQNTGALFGYMANCTSCNCYGLYTFSNIFLVGNAHISSLVDYTFFANVEDSYLNTKDGILTLLEPILFEESVSTELLDALNKGVVSLNREDVMLWKSDSLDTNGGFPVFEKKYNVLCQNVSDVIVHNVVKDLEVGVEISWNENGDANDWQIRYGWQIEHDGQTRDTIVIKNTTNNPDTLWGIPIGKMCVIEIRPICDSTHRGGWSKGISHIVDKPYWTEIVTKQPSGYVVDFKDDIHISSAEGLAWLSCVVNGLHGMEANNLEGRTIFLENNIDIRDFKWKAITQFSGNFEGKNKTISGLYVNEAYDYQGLFGIASNGSIVNTILDDVYVRGQKYVGALCGYMSNVTVKKCSVAGTCIGVENIGGLLGEVEHCTIDKCHVICDVMATHDQTGGLVGSVIGNTMITNCCVKGLLQCQNFCVGGFVGGCDAICGDVFVKNSFASVEVIGYVFCGGLAGSARGFYGYKVNFVNCYFNGIIASVPTNPPSTGALIGHTSGRVSLNHCFANRNGNRALLGNHEGDTSELEKVNINVYVKNDTACLIEDSLIHNEQKLDDVLNEWVLETSDSTYLTWTRDSLIETRGLPIFDKAFVEQYLAPYIYLDSLWETGASIKWNKNGAKVWELKCVEHDNNTETSFTEIIYDTVVDVSDLIAGKMYDIYVRVLGESGHSKWSNVLSIKPDKKHWKDIVTSKPNDYKEDVFGNVHITSAESLAWLMSCCCGFNGMQSTAMSRRIIYIEKDIDLSKYQWSTIPFFDGIIQGNGHTISGLYINENTDSLSKSTSMFMLCDGSIYNVNFKKCFIKGPNANILCNTLRGKLINCGFQGEVQSVKGVSYANAIMEYNAGFVYNCYANVSVKGHLEPAGFIWQNDGTIANCYSSGRVTFSYGTKCAQFTIQDYNPSNLNCNYWLLDTYNYRNNISGSAYSSPIGYTSFSLDSTLLILNNPVSIAGENITNLLDALNAWVDANNSEGQYLHWVEDTANVNDGYPILKQEPIALPKYIITFCNDDGTILQQDTLELGEMPEYRGGIPTKDSTEQYNYTFIGWSQEVVPVTKDVTYYAQYEATLNQYEINFYDWDGTLLQSSMMNYGEWPAYYNSDPWREADAQYTYTFSGWSPELSMVTGHLSYYAQYEATLNQYEINFCNWDGTLLQSEWLNYGEWPNYYNSEPTREADAQYTYTFSGWSPELSMVTGHLSYYAQYESTLNQYEINFYNWDGTLLQSNMVNYGEWPMYYNSDPWRESDAQYTYTFTGWSPRLDWVSGNQAYYAQYESTLNQYEITFYNWNGELLQSSMVNYGEWPNYYNSEPTREADAQYTYNFSGWSPELSVVTGNQSYTAQYESTLNQYEINFYNWDGTLLQSTMVNYGEWPAYYNSDPWREADAQYTYTFTGWSPQLDMVTGNQSYYAQYEATLNQYEVTFYNWNGEVLQSTMVDFGAMPEYFGVTPTKPEDDQYVYTFSGWEPEITIVVAYAEYTAQYDATDKVTTVIENTQSDEVKTYKILRNNKIFIIRGDKVYSILGHVIEDWMPLGL